jgi:RNA polymerase sigma factor (sigma-70 family)
MRQISSKKAVLSYQFLYATTLSQSRVAASEEAELTEQYIWKKRALYVKKKHGIINRMEWADALGLTPILLLQALREAEIAESRLLAMGLRLSLKLAEKQYSRTYYRDFYDYVQDGLVIFFDAVESFDSSKGTRLSTYSYSRIKFYFADLSRLHGANTPPLEQVHINDCDKDYFTNDIHLQENVVNVRRALRALPDRQRLILERKFGIQGKAQPICDIAKDFGVSCETIRKDKKMAIAALSGSSYLKPLVA